MHFIFVKGWLNHRCSPGTLTATSKALEIDNQPREYEHTLSLQSNKAIRSEEKLNELYTFLEKSEQAERKKQLMGTAFYNNLISYINRSKKDISEGKPVQKKRL